jgi:hypothetical protein
VKLLLALALLWPLFLVARLAWRLRRPRAALAVAASPPTREIQAQLARSALSTDVVIDALPPLDPVRLLADLRPIAPPAVDVSLLGVVDDRSAAEHALWRAAQRALASRRS